MVFYCIDLDRNVSVVAEHQIGARFVPDIGCDEGLAVFGAED